MNKKNSILLLDPEFDPDTAHLCNLLLRITNDSFSYAIINEEHKRLKAVFDEQECDDIIQTLKSNLRNDPYLKYPFKAVKIAVATENCITVPNELFQDTAVNSYSNFFAAKNAQPIHTRQNAHFDFTTVFNLEETLEQELDTQFKAAAKYEPGVALAKMAEGVENGLYIDFTAGTASVLLLAQSKLVYKNSFETDSAEEFNYYLLLMISQLGIGIKQTPVFLSGIINEGDEKYLIVQKYFSSIGFSDPANSDLDCTILEDMPNYYYSNLLAIDLCV